MKQALIVYGAYLPPIKLQHVAAVNWGAGAIRLIDGNLMDFTIDDWIACIPLGVSVGVFRLYCLAPAGRYRSLARHETMIERFRRISAKAELIELETGRSGRKTDDIYAMLGDAQSMRWRPAEKSRRGRPLVHNYTAAERRRILALWNDKRHGSTDERIAAVRAEFPLATKAMVYRLKKSEGAA